eukprot:368348-Prorocentrum_minimum.AAC.1
MSSAQAVKKQAGSRPEDLIESPREQKANIPGRGVPGPSCLVPGGAMLSFLEELAREKITTLEKKNASHSIGPSLSPML